MQSLEDSRILVVRGIECAAGGVNGIILCELG